MISCPSIFCNKIVLRDSEISKCQFYVSENNNVLCQKLEKLDLYVYRKYEENLL